MATDEDVTLTIEAPDGTQDTLTLPGPLLEMLAEADETAPEVVGDMAMLTCANQVHHAAHHGEEVGEDLESTEERTMDLFEERFGVTFGEATGHSH